MYKIYTEDGQTVVIRCWNEEPLGFCPVNRGKADAQHEQHCDCLPNL